MSMYKARVAPYPGTFNATVWSAYNFATHICLKTQKPKQNVGVITTPFRDWQGGRWIRFLLLYFRYKRSFSSTHFVFVQEVKESILKSNISNSIILFVILA